MLHFLPTPDPARWAACVAASPGAPPGVQAWWLAATAGPCAAVVELGPAGDYRSLLPVPRKWRLGWQAYQPLFTPPLGLLLTAASQQRGLADYLRLAARHCAGGFCQHLPPAARPLPPLPPGFAATGRLTYHLDLGPAHADLLRAYAPDYRRRLRRNQELAQPLGVGEGADLDELIGLLLAYRGRAHTGLRAGQYAALRRLGAAAQAQGTAELRQVRHPATDELLAGALFVRHAGGVVYLFAAASAAGRTAGAPLLLLDDALRRHAGQPGRVLDFEGGNLPGIGRFFAGFGAQPVLYPVLTLTRPAWLPRLFSWIRP